MDKNTVIGFTLIFILLFAYQQIFTPSQAELEAERQTQDSLAWLEQMKQDSLAVLDKNDAGTEISEEKAPAIPDSLRNLQLLGAYGPFAEAADGQEEEFKLENDVFEITFTNKGGRIKDVKLKQYFKVGLDDKGKEVKSELRLLEDAKNKFEYFLPVANLPSGGVSTGELYFDAKKTGDAITFRADAGGGRYFEQTYRLSSDTYQLEYDIKFEGLNGVISREAENIQLNWINYLGKLEKSTRYERNYSTVYYKVVDQGPDHCNCMKSDTEDSQGLNVKWVSNANQFFNSTLLAKEHFGQAFMETDMLDDEADDLKKLSSKIQIPYAHGQSETFAMRMYIGPNEFDRLRAMGEDLEDIIPFGSSIFGSINRWIIRPIFNFLSSFIGSKGIVILMLTFIVKMLFYPLTYKMLYSQSKMAALKPFLADMKEKFKDDPQKQQMEQMKVYREYGVNPLGGCLPMVVQMPIWFALYRFFPAAIEFRQAGFLWATDLSSYDIFVRLPFEVPLGFGAHISLFTLLWAATTLIYTYYNSKHMDMSANPAMKYMQYLMPVMFLGFFNSYAAGLTCYLFFSNVFNIGQTIVTKNFIIDQEKIKEQMLANKKKPKKRSGFQKRLEEALKEQQKKQAQQKKGKK